MLLKTTLIDLTSVEVFPCRCDSKHCNYKKQWEDAGSPFRIPVEVGLGKQYMPLVSEWLKTKYCNRRGEQTLLKT